MYDLYKLGTNCNQICIVIGVIAHFINTKHFEGPFGKISNNTSPFLSLSPSISFPALCVVRTRERKERGRLSSPLKIHQINRRKKWKTLRSLQNSYLGLLVLIFSPLSLKIWNFLHFLGFAQIWNFCINCE